MSASVMVNSQPAKATEKKTYIDTLATPKQSKAIWLTSFGRNVAWGNQEPLTTISPDALRASATERVCTLATSKKNHQSPDKHIAGFYYSCGRSSLIWGVKPLAMTATPSERVTYLARHKTVPVGYLEQRADFLYSCGRSSTIWETGPRVRRWSYPQVRPRTAALARAKQTHPDYRPCKQVQTIVSDGAKSAVSSEHTTSLSAAKSRPDGPFRDPQWTVSKTAMEATPTDRVTDLAKPKRLADSYRPCREPIWKVTTGAMNATVSNRLEDLSKPIIREKMDHVQFNPDAFNVSEAAKKARASARIEELAQPITRGV